MLQALYYIHAQIKATGILYADKKNTPDKCLTNPHLSQSVRL